jgi:hypothetical protein
VPLHLAPISLRAANTFVDEVHRHHGSVRGHRFSVSVVDDDDVVRGVGIAGRPKSRVLDQQGFIEVVRVATDGERNACSMLYGALRRAAIALGYEPSKIITYTLQSEDGGSLRASGWHEVGRTTGGTWDTPSRPRTDDHPTEPKVRWAAAPPTRG